MPSVVFHHGAEVQENLGGPAGAVPGKVEPQGNLDSVLTVESLERAAGVDILDLVRPLDKVDGPGGVGFQDGAGNPVGVAFRLGPEQAELRDGPDGVV